MADNSDSIEFDINNQLGMVGSEDVTPITQDSSTEIDETKGRRENPKTQTKMKQVHGIKWLNVTLWNVPKGEGGKPKVLTKYKENEEGGK